ncbi:hypothetical protein QE152_g31466 [Popillia japonica]|uniref:Uncharacterized protein n=1 Tax=Popillia japonica TaxID=7064 RepID=A0AAW1J1G3_POPJA
MSYAIYDVVARITKRQVIDESRLLQIFKPSPLTPLDYSHYVINLCIAERVNYIMKAPLDYSHYVINLCIAERVNYIMKAAKLIKKLKWYDDMGDECY